MLKADEEDKIFEDTQQELLQGDNQEEFQISLHALSGIHFKAMVKDFKWTMQGVEFTIDMKLLPLGGCDMVIGVQWLSILGSVLWDFKNLKMEFIILVAKHTLKGGEVPAVQLVDAKTMEQLLRRHPLGVMAQMCNIQAETSEQVQVNPEISMLLQNYEDVFSEPQGLPPVRAHDHQIPLFPSTQPPSIRPYRYPYIQKNEIEKIITTPMQQKWLSKMMGFDYEIVYRSGKSNVVADALSRMVENTDLISENQGSLTALTVVFYNWMLYYKSRLVVGKDDQFRLKLIQEHHASPTGGHSGGERSYYRLKQAFYWKGMKRAVLKFVAECDTCQRNKNETVASPALLQPLPIHDRLWSDISMDFIEGLLISTQKSVIFVVVDRLSKDAHFIPLTHPYTATIVAQAFLDNVFKLHGMPRCLTGDRPKVWAHWLPLAEWWYNTTFHISTGITPYEALYGQSPLNYRHYIPGGTTIAAADGLLKDRETVLKLLKEHLISSQHRMKQITNSHRTEREFEVIQRDGAVASKLDLPPSSRIHPVFHMSLLKKKLGFGAVFSGQTLFQKTPLGRVGMSCSRDFQIFNLEDKVALKGRVMISMEHQCYQWYQSGRSLATAMTKTRAHEQKRTEEAMNLLRESDEQLVNSVAHLTNSIAKIKELVTTLSEKCDQIASKRVSPEPEHGESSMDPSRSNSSASIFVQIRYTKIDYPHFFGGDPTG
ncbi:hypothetical protein RHSIM_RhsimUnG0031100 [Rhododendron simsii]|uniref:Integrase catalytic domain-containing protein n=1 Tax=Rhododendron simsii TaxID=118357 RepID=A0A834L520_RHOSS|nr:hypothetical protein RHSIM_RhsimUnG0031100 [Rhododendron simsii]